MNYRHHWHAGNFADVFKHLVLVALIEHLHRKETPCLLLDTHAGQGTYDLLAPPAKTTGESLNGIARLLNAAAPPPLVERYLSCFPANGHYPGSPWIMQHLLRPADRLILCEWQPDVCATLKKILPPASQIAIHHRDGWQSLKAFLPPRENRGLVLIDPPYEKADEFLTVANTLASALARWPNGLFALWYPIKSSLPVRALQRDLMALPRPTQLIDIRLHPGGGRQGLAGCGMAIINPPWQLGRTLTPTLDWLCRALGPETRFQMLPAAT